MTYRVHYSEEDQEYVGTCEQYPSLSYLAVSARDALLGIQKLVSDIKSFERNK